VLIGQEDGIIAGHDRVLAAHLVALVIPQGSRENNKAGTLLSTV
jgi:hypothetical protein